eukprot:2556645-Rhodomonas_salina.2
MVISSHERLSSACTSFVDASCTPSSLLAISCFSSSETSSLRKPPRIAWCSCLHAMSRHRSSTDFSIAFDDPGDGARMWVCKRASSCL